MLLQHMRDGVLPSVQQTKHVPSSSQSTKDFYLTFFLCNSHQSYAIVIHERRCLPSKTVDRTFSIQFSPQRNLPPFPSSAPAIPCYARETLSSQQHSRQNLLESQSLLPLNLKPSESLELPSFMSDLDSIIDAQPVEKAPQKVGFYSFFFWPLWPAVGLTIVVFVLGPSCSVDLVLC